MVEVAVRYLRPLRFDEVVDVHLTLASVRGATFQIGYLLTVDGQPGATAVTVHGVLVGGRPGRVPGWLQAFTSPG